MVVDSGRWFARAKLLHAARSRRALINGVRPRLQPSSTKIHLIPSAISSRRPVSLRNRLLCASLRRRRDPILDFLAGRPYRFHGDPTNWKTALSVPTRRTLENWMQTADVASCDGSRVYLSDVRWNFANWARITRHLWTLEFNQIL